MRYPFILIFGLMCIKSYCQDIIIQPPIFGPFECTDFFKLYTGSVSNFTGQIIKGQMVLQVNYTNPSGRSFRLADGLLRGTTDLEFPSGLTLIDHATVERIYPIREIRFYDKAIENLLQRTKCLPPGEYQVCLSFYPPGPIDGSTRFLTQTCYEREVGTFSPLLLISPFDGDEVASLLPLLSWTAVTPIFPEARYRIQMVEVMGNQTAFEAFRANPLFFSKTGLISNILQYPISARPLLPCARFAWRVMYELAEGLGGNEFSKTPGVLQESEIWEFHTPCQEEESVRKNAGISLITPNYFKTGKENSGNYVIIDGEFLRFISNFSYRDRPALEFSIFNERMELVSTGLEAYNETIPNAHPDLPLDEQYGDNRFIIRLPASVTPEKPYVLVVSDTKSREYLRFKKRP